MRLVPFAVVESSPKKISAGSVSDDPPPPITFINPLIVPTLKSINADVKSNNATAGKFYSTI